MKNSILLATFLIGSFLGTSVYADDLKRSCIKDNPLVSGETDPTLIGIYAQVCDKKNKDNKNAYLVQAAQQFQKMGQNFKALQIVNDLNAQNFNHSALTDVKFLAGIGIADQALGQIRNKEVRYLTDEGYDASLKLNDAVKRAKPLAVIEKTYEAPVKPYVPVKKPPVKKPPVKKPPVKSNTNNKPKSPVTNKGPERVSPFGGVGG